MNWSGKLSVGYQVNFENKKATFIHRAIAESVLRKPLPHKAVVHHVNNNRADNRKNNLVICNNQAYHRLLHRREIALKSCGNASFRKYTFCKKWDSAGNLYVNDKHRKVYHRDCIRLFRKHEVTR